VIWWWDFWRESHGKKDELDTNSKPPDKTNVTEKGTKTYRGRRHHLE
jgi:hypothetical protein